MIIVWLLLFSHLPLILLQVGLSVQRINTYGGEEPEAHLGRGRRWLAVQSQPGLLWGRDWGGASHLLQAAGAYTSMTSVTGCGLPWPLASWGSSAGAILGLVAGGFLPKGGSLGSKKLMTVEDLAGASQPPPDTRRPPSTSQHLHHQW